MLNPLISDAAGDDIHSSESLPSQIRLERCCEAAGVGTFDVKGARVPLDLHINAPKPAVSKSALPRAGDDVQRIRQGRRQGLAELLDGQLRSINRRPSIQRDRILLGGLESSILNELGVDAAVTGIVDVLYALSTCSFVGEGCKPVMQDKPRA